MQNTTPAEHQYEEQSDSSTHSSFLACSGQIADKPTERKIIMQNKSWILPKIHGEVTPQTRLFPFALMLHWHHRTGDSTHTGGGGGESRGVSGEGEREGGSFISSSHHPLPLLLLSVISLVLCQKTNYMKKAKSLSWMQLGSRGEKQSGAEKRTRTSSLHHLHREEWDASFFSWERDYKVHCGAPPYIPPIPPSVPCLSTAHVTSPRCHSDGATCCRQEGEEERKKGGGKKNIRGKKK